MGVVLPRNYLGNSHVCNLEVGEGGISRNFKLLYHFDLVEEYFDWFLHMVQCLHNILILR